MLQMDSLQGTLMKSLPDSHKTHYCSTENSNVS